MNARIVKGQVKAGSLRIDPITLMTAVQKAEFTESVHEKVAAYDRKQRVKAIDELTFNTPALRARLLGAMK
jgi:hypothetical protein